MRLYLNDKEADLIRLTLLTSTVTMHPNMRHVANTIIDRIDLCNKLQNNERRSKENA